MYAEDPSRDFLPSIGRLAHVAMPAVTADVRIDTGVRQGDEITPFYDPMIAKLIVHGATRAEAIARMRAALAEISDSRGAHECRVSRKAHERTGVRERRAGHRAHRARA